MSGIVSMQVAGGISISSSLMMSGQISCAEFLRIMSALILGLILVLFGIFNFWYASIGRFVAEDVVYEDDEDARLLLTLEAQKLS